MDFVCQTNHTNELNANNTFQPWINTSQALVEEALDRWDAKELRADNVSVVCVIFNALQEEQKNEMTSSIQQMHSIEVGQHILLDHCYEETFKLKMIDNFTCAYNDDPLINRDNPATVNTADFQHTSSSQCEESKSIIIDDSANSYDDDTNFDRSIVSHEIENLPESSTESLLNEAEVKLPKINNKENSKVQKKIQTTSSNKFYETRQKDRKMRSGHVMSSAVKKTTRRRSAKVIVETISHAESSKGASKNVNSPTLESKAALRSASTYFLKESDRSSGNYKYLKLNNILLSKKRKLFGTKSTKRLNAEKTTRKSQKH